MTNGRGGRYSRPVAVLSLAAALAFLVFASGPLPNAPDLGDTGTYEGVLYEGVQASHYTQGYCQVLPCHFPEGDVDEPSDPTRIAGFVMSVEALSGTDFHYPHTDTDTGYDWNTSEGYTDNAAEIGVDAASGRGIRFYQDGIEGSDGRSYKMSVDVRSADVTGTGDCGNEPDGSYDNCDIYMWTPEIAFRYVSATALGLDFTMERYWVVRPEHDWCRTSLVQTCLATAGDNDADIDMTRGYVRGYWFRFDQATLTDATFSIDHGQESFPLEWNCNDRASDHRHVRNDQPGCY